MSDFEKNTERLAVEFSPNYNNDPRASSEHFGFTMGRNSAKESLEILARAAEHLVKTWEPHLDAEIKLAEAIAAVKRLGEWPL